jgi:hypothetical protein
MVAKKAPAKKMAAPKPAPKKTSKTADSSKLSAAGKKNLAASAKMRTDKTGSSGMGMNKGGVAFRAQEAGDRANTNNAISNSPGQADMRRRGASDADIARAMKANVARGTKAFNALAKKYGVTGLSYSPSSIDRITKVIKKKK